MKYRKISLLLFLALAFGPFAGWLSAQDVTVSNIRAEQRSGTKLVDILYDLEYDGEDRVEIGVQVSADGGTSFDVVPVETLTGAVGQDYSIEPGTDLLITWNAGSDWKQQYTEQAIVKVSAATFIPDPNAPPPGFALVEAGTFTMGSPVGELGRNPTYEIEFEATLTRDYFIKQTEVTNAEMAEAYNWALGEGLITATSGTTSNVDGDVRELLDLDNPDSQVVFSGGVFSVKPGTASLPVAQVSWYGAMAYCEFLSQMEGESAVDFTDWTADFDALGYRLPTEAEWEYACRAGTTTAFYNGGITNTGSSPIDPNLDQIGWYKGNTGSASLAVGGKDSNDLGIFDMNGNVEEWCYDLFNTYPTEPTIDPVGASGSYRSVRGGSFRDDADDCRSAARASTAPHIPNRNTGFRVVRTVVLEVAP